MKTLNLVLAFLLELAMLVAYGVKGLTLPLAEPLPMLAAVLLPLFVLAVWGLLAAPKARFPLSVGGTYALKGGLLWGGAALLASAGQPVWAAVDAGLIAVNLGGMALWGQMNGRPTKASFRASLRRLVADYRRRWGSDGAEAATADRFDEFARSGEVLQGKANPRRHITASTWIVNPNRTRVLLTHHAKLNKWVQLGGHTDEGEDWGAAALREATEESGLSGLRLAQPGLFDLDIHEIPARADTPAHNHYDLRFLVEADDAVPLTISDESHDLAWVSLDELEKYTTEESQLRMARKTRP